MTVKQRRFCFHHVVTNKIQSQSLLSNMFIQSSSRLQLQNHHQLSTTAANTLPSKPKIHKLSSSSLLSSVPVTNLDNEHTTQMVDDLYHRTRSLMMNEPIIVHNSTTNTTNTTNTDTIRYTKYQHIIAFSGGIDSSLVAAMIHRVCCDVQHPSNHHNTATTTMNRDNDKKRDIYEQLVPENNITDVPTTTTTTTHTATAMIGISPAVSKEQIMLAEQISIHIGIPLQQVYTNEGQHETYIQNNGYACYVCKSELYHTLIHESIMKYNGIVLQPQDDDRTGTTTTTNDIPSNRFIQNYIQNNNDHTTSTTIYNHDTTIQHIPKLYNGTNADDCLDPTRLGLRAASKYHVLSPIQHLSKHEIRMIAKHIGLPNYNIASNPCLRSRLAIGVQATQDHLYRIERAERYIRQELYNYFHTDTNTAIHHVTTMSTTIDQQQQHPILSVETNLRVRLLSQQRACIEIDEIYVPIIQDLYDHHHTIQQQWDHMFITTLQFQSIMIRPFRSGSVATTTATTTPNQTTTKLSN